MSMLLYKMRAVTTCKHFPNKSYLWESVVNKEEMHFCNSLTPYGWQHKFGMLPGLNKISLNSLRCVSTSGAAARSHPVTDFTSVRSFRTQHWCYRRSVCELLLPHACAVVLCNSNCKSGSGSGGWKVFGNGLKTGNYKGNELRSLRRKWARILSRFAPRIVTSAATLIHSGAKKWNTKYQII